MVRRKVRVGVIGLGMGANHARDYRACKDAELAAVCDIDAKCLARWAPQFRPARAYLCYPEMFEKEDLDAVSVAVPNDRHHRVTCDALDAGLHVLCEKPMALNVAEARGMRDLARRRKRKLMINFSSRWRPESRALKRMVDAGKLGKIYWGRTRWLRSRGYPAPGSWFTDRKRSGGGPLIDLGVHRIDLALWFMGFPKVSTVTAATYHHLARKTARRQKRKWDTEDLATAFLRFENGATLTVEASWDLNGEWPEDLITELYGSEGGLIQRNVGGVHRYEMKLFRDRGKKVVEVVPRVARGDAQTSMAHFVDCIVRDRPVEASAEEGLYVMKILDAIYASAAKGREVKLR